LDENANPGADDKFYGFGKPSQVNNLLIRS
jgi:hypothetical protein